MYRIGGRHFVSDGHHRVSIAAATGQQTIDAHVTEILTTKLPTALSRAGIDPDHHPQERQDRDHPVRAQDRGIVR